jgi:methyl-accepting chemotaxis protein
MMSDEPLAGNIARDDDCPCDHPEGSVRLSLRIKLLGAFGAMLMLTILVGVIGVNEAGRINSGATDLYDNDVIGTEEVTTLSQSAEQMRALVLAHILATDPARKTALEADIAHLDQVIDTTLAQIRAGDVDERQRAALALFTQSWDGYRRARDGATLPASRAGNSVQALGAYSGEEATRFDAAGGAIDTLVGLKAAAARTADAENDADYATTRRLIAGATLLAVVLGLGLALGLAHNIARTASQVAAAAEGLAHGNLNQQLTVRSRDELGQMATAFREMIVQQRRATEQLQGGAQDLAAASSEILAAAAQQAAGANEQAAALAQTTATVEEVRASAEHAMQLADGVNTSAGQASRVAEDGVVAVQHATAGIAELRERVGTIAESILVLAEHSQQIGEIIATVSDLADQSHLLALNAAIEASRAGEHGRGFGVVAQEIRSLAEGSKAATAQVRTILSDIQRATNTAVLATEQGTKGADRGAALVDQAGQTIEELAGAIRESAGAAAQIAASARQHAVGMVQVAAAMRDINQATAQNLAATADTQQAAANLSGLATNLNGLVARDQL